MRRVLQMNFLFCLQILNKTEKSSDLVFAAE